MTDKEIARFWSRVRIPENRLECWEWIGNKFNEGYGSFWCQGTRFLAHRVSFLLERVKVGPLPMVLDHLCHNRACINPHHLRPSTVRENSQNLRSKRRGLCTSSFPGVKLNHGRWEANVYAKGSRVYLGSFDSELEAARAYQGACRFIEKHPMFSLVK